MGLLDVISVRNKSVPLQTIIAAREMGRVLKLAVVNRGGRARNYGVEGVGINTVCGNNIAYDGTLLFPHT